MIHCDFNNIYTAKLLANSFQNVLFVQNFYSDLWEWMLTPFSTFTIKFTLAKFILYFLYAF